MKAVAATRPIARGKERLVALVVDGIEDGATFDVAVIGTGGAGLAAALFAALRGGRVLLVERTPFVGGSTALSAGTAWMPLTPHAAEVGRVDDAEAVRSFLDHAVGSRSDPAIRAAFVEAAPRAVAELEALTEARFRARPFHPDYLSELPGSRLGGRAIEPKPYDGRRLGRLFRLIRPPIPEFTLFGGLMVDRDDIAHLLKLTRSFASFRHALRLMVRYARDRLAHRRGTRLVMGNALIARLLASLMPRDVTLLTEAEVGRIDRRDGRVSGLSLTHRERNLTVTVKRGVILASGGFNRHPTRRAERLGATDPAWCPGAPGHTGRAIDLALGLGARLGEGGLSDAFWAPVSLRKRPDGSTAVFPHFLLDRGKPGMVTVDRRGRRFVNEATSYHLFGLAMREAEAIPAHLITDAAGLAKYGLGMIRPAGGATRPFLADGYLVQAATLRELAERLGIDGDGLEATVAAMNRSAETGIDPDFGRGSTDYQRANGDATHGPNPCLGPIATPPYSAVRLYPGDIGAAAGLVTDARARVLGAAAVPIAGLWAVGNDMRSIMGGVYPAPGITIGPALAFAHLAARDAMGEEESRVQ